ncbi:Sec-independent protein translocase protein TatB [Limnobaculum parvum]|uniref:Sec-independent protein translocase protein TatB n=1 Tax=Limnobaculum parvum TaxID=2172103 RepID=A0A2Y9TYD0_9GAMM|nr:Sec-independent protein translocase protein TatB [Limnobaculum parvum]AWH88622.1 Sec-independent protein translocase subunit TatB [Limnobaculum parvum]
MFDIGFGEIVLVLIIGLVVLGPERLPVAVKTVTGWIRAMRSLASSVQNELTQELKLQELKESLKKAEQAGLQNLSPELKASMDELKEMATGMKRNIQSDLNNAAESFNASPTSAADADKPSVSATDAAAKAAEAAAANKSKVPPVASVAEPVVAETAAQPEPVSINKPDSEK